MTIAYTPKEEAVETVANTHSRTRLAPPAADEIKI
jgi:hypothetical protein